MKFLKRTMEAALLGCAGQYPVVTVTGPRQSGKTTLCRRAFPDKVYVSLENTDTRLYAREDPRGFLAELPDGAIVDEIQNAPDLPSYIQTIVDEAGTTTNSRASGGATGKASRGATTSKTSGRIGSRASGGSAKATSTASAARTANSATRASRKDKGLFILTGSQQFEVATTVNQSLAGRTALLKLLPLSLEELGAQGKRASLDRLLLSGFYPRIWAEGLQPAQALANYVETYVERDIRSLLAVKDLSMLQRFITLCAGRVGQLLNLNAIAADCGISHQTARNWLTLLEASFIVFRLPPYFANVRKRLVKSPKLYFYDVGLAAFLLGLENESHVRRHPLRGNLFENMLVMEALKYRLHRGRRSNMHFYRDSNGNEVDLLLNFGPDLFLIEIKSGQTVNSDYFKSLKHFTTVFNTPLGAALLYAGKERQQRGGIKVRPFRALPELLAENDA